MLTQVHVVLTWSHFDPLHILDCLYAQHEHYTPGFYHRHGVPVRPQSVVAHWKDKHVQNY